MYTKIIISTYRVFLFESLMEFYGKLSFMKTLAPPLHLDLRIACPLYLLQIILQCSLYNAQVSDKVTKIVKILHDSFVLCACKQNVVNFCSSEF